MLLAGCSHGATARPPTTPRVVLLPDGHAPVEVRVELARTAGEQQRGLMYRDRLADGAGMLFLFDRSRHQVFWMRNTYIPLDMIFISTDKRVVGVVERAEPLTDDPRAVDGDSQYVLEVPGGYAVANRIGPGTTVRFVDVE
jgi:uncharacterized membrane protein (UPF0127 family)